MAGNWLIVGALCGPDDGIYPALALLPAADFTVDDVWHTDVHESRAVIGTLTEASGASAHFLGSPLQRFKRDVDVIAGHVVFDYDTSRELAGALTLGMKISRTAMV